MHITNTPFFDHPIRKNGRPLTKSFDAFTTNDSDKNFFGKWGSPGFSLRV
jgi:hypothetical protein